MYWVWVALASGFSAYAIVKHGLDLKKLVWHWVAKRDQKFESWAANVVRDMVHFTSQHNRFAPGLELEVDEYKDEFLKNALKAYMTGAIRGPDLLRTLRQAAEEREVIDLSGLDDLDSIRKFLPAMGWGAALLGLAWFFTEGHAEGMSYMQHAGYIFASVIAVVMYGLALSFFVLGPVEGHIIGKADATRRKNHLVIEGMSLILRKKSPFEVYEHLHLLLPPGVHVDLSDVLPAAETQSA
jgi:flagellar motor component MotA